MQELWWKPVQDREDNYWLIPTGRESEWDTWVESSQGEVSEAPPWAVRLNKREG